MEVLQKLTRFKELDLYESFRTLKNPDLFKRSEFTKLRFYQKGTNL